MTFQAGMLVVARQARRRGVRLWREAFRRGSGDRFSACSPTGRHAADSQPSNIFLCEQRIERAVLIDFGVARGGPGLGRGTTSLTGQILGTPGYLAPELALSEASATPQADLFSLGCVLFECLTGRPPFIGTNLTAVLAKTLFEQPPSLQLLRPDIAPALGRLIGRMLEKDQKQRPESAAALLAELERIETAGSTASVVLPEATQALTAGERRLVTMLVAAAAATPVGIGDGATWHEPAAEALRSALGGNLEHAARLPNGTLVAAFTQQPGEEASDHAERAVRSALLLKELLPQSCVVVATGRGSFPERLPTGDAVDRAVELLVDVTSAAGPVLTDDVTAGLVGTRFDLRRLRNGLFAVSSERDVLDSTRPLLGQPTPCVGREQELALLDAALVSTIERSVSRLVLVTGPPGVGKSRLRHEFMRRVGARSAECQMWIGRGEPMGTGSPFALMGQILRRVCDVSSGEEPGAQRAKLLARVGVCVPSTELTRVAEMIGELCGIPFPAESSPRLRTARNEPRTMMAHITQAFIDLLWAECARQPLMLVLEDLHLADSLSIALIDAALHALAEQPLFILALARPEAVNFFPNLWTEHGAQRLRLGALGKRACERLARQVLGGQASAQTISEIVQHSAGNALYLEELIRAVAEDKPAELPDSVLAMLQARLLHLPTDERRVLRAASVFGEVFWLGGVLSLLGKERQADTVRSQIDILIGAEIVEPQPGSRFSGDAEYRFRHGLAQEAAYQLLTEEDRALGHRLAGAFLASRGERDSMLIAEHFERGGDLDRALPYFIAAAEHALQGSDLEGALQRADRGLRCKTDRTALGSLASIQLAAYFWQNEWTEAYESGNEALAQLDLGSPRWFRAAALMLPVLNFASRPAELMALAAQIDSITPPDESLTDYVQAVSYLVIVFSLLGQQAAAEQHLERLQAYVARFGAQADGVRGLMLFSEVVLERLLRANPWRSWELAREAVAASERAGDLRNLLFVKAFWGLCLIEMKDLPAAESCMRENVALGQRLHEPLLLTNAMTQLELFLIARGTPSDLEEAFASAQQTLQMTRGNEFLRGQVLVNLASVNLLRGEYAQAVEMVRVACQCLAFTPAYRLNAEYILLYALLASRQTEEAVVQARESLARLEVLGCGGHWEISLRAAAVTALLAGGQIEEARVQCRIACRALYARAATITDPELRQRYTHGLRAHVRLHELATQLIAGEADFAET